MDLRCFSGDVWLHVRGQRAYVRRMGQPDVLGSCAALPWRALLALYADLATDSPDHATWAAIALRNKARLGELPESVIPILALCLRDAAAPGAVVNLAKALAAFGREASIASPFLIERIRQLHVTDDELFWVLDGCLYALGFIGGKDAPAFLEELGRLPVSPAIRAGRVYQGELTVEDRTEMFKRALEKVGRMLASDPGCWRGRATKLASGSLPPREKRGVLDARGATAKKDGKAKKHRGLV